MFISNVTLNIYEYLQCKLTAVEFRELYNTFGLSKRATTYRLLRPRLLTSEMIAKLGIILDADITELIKRFELGYDELTAQQYINLLAN